MQQTMRSTSWNPNEASDLTGPTAGISRRQPPPPASSASTTSNNPSFVPNVSGRIDVAKKKSSTPNSGRISVGKLSTSKNGISVEYYFTSSGVWTQRASLTLSKTKNKLYLDILDPQPPSRR